MARGKPTDLFPTDDPIAASEMIGRSGDVSAMVARLGDAAVNVVVVGPRRTGKTTVCRAAVEQLAARGHYTMSVDLFLLSRVEQLADALIEGAIANRAVLRKALFAAKQQGKSLLEAIGITVAAKTGGVELEGVEINLLPQLKHEPERYLEYALRLPQRIARSDGKRLVLFIDEFQDVVRIGDADHPGGSEGLTRAMRAVFQDSPDVVFLFAGSIEHMMQDLFGRTDQAFFNFGSFLDLSPITRDEWRAGLRLRFDRDRTRIDDDALDRIIELGEAQPRATMLVAQQAHLSSIIAGTRHVTLTLAELGLREAMRSDRKRHDALVEHVQALGPKGVRRTALPVAVALARGEPATAAAGTQWQANRTLKVLRDAGITEGKGRNRVGIADPLFARYLRELAFPASVTPGR